MVLPELCQLYSLRARQSDHFRIEFREQDLGGCETETSATTTQPASSGDAVRNTMHLDAPVIRTTGLRDMLRSMRR